MMGFTLCVGAAPAEEIRAVFKEATPNRETLTVHVGGQERTLTPSARIKVFGLNGAPLKDGLHSKLFQQPGVFLFVKTETRDGKEVVTEIRLLRRSAHLSTSSATLTIRPRPVV